ncbi:MAG: indole-3-glycerol phosphate synthase TrpC [Acidobacteria bacterium]|nr:indole-3-glycerol phosphate synthase TrpC [Acidobacteriota bacterium]
MPTTLDQILTATRQRVQRTKQSANLRELERKAQAHTPRGFRQGLIAKGKVGFAVIAELKKASPSKGLIRADFDPPALARELEAGGAAALSVLTDEEFFQGSLANLERASASVQIPCLRKDFMVDEFQMVEARAHGADAILLIVAALAQPELTALARQAKAYGLDILCEVHDEAELQRALDAGCELIGVNSRDLRTFQVDLETVFRLAERFPGDITRVAESGIHCGEDLARLQAAGYDAFLIGESLMKTAKPGETLQALLGSRSPLASRWR